MIQILAYISLFLLLTGCITKKTDLSIYYPLEDKQVAVAIYHAIEYDGRGRPLFTGRLKERPARAGEQFTLAQFVDERPVRSFDIAITSDQPDMTRPFRVLYEWTGKGFRAGLAGVKAFSEKIVHEKQRDEAVSFSQRSTTGYEAVGIALTSAVGGFIIGLAASVPATFQELGRVVVSDYEKVISYSVYEYDGKQRLAGMKTYSPDDLSQEIIKTSFFYQDEETIPSKTEIISYPESTVRSTFISFTRLPPSAV